MATALPVATGYTADSLQAAEHATSSSLSASSLLEQIFGTIAVNPMNALDGVMGAGDILGTVFMFINMGLLTLGGIYLSYKGIGAITQTAHEGEFMGKSFNSIWVPIRITTGIFSLIPIAGGWSLLQVAMLWFGIMGAGLGNMAWQAAVGKDFLPFKSVTLSPTPNGSFDKQFVPELLRMHVCIKAMNAQTGQSDSYGWSDVQPAGAVPGYRVYGAATSTGGRYAQCGKISFSDIAKGANSNFVGKNSSLWGATESSALGIATEAQKKAVNAAIMAEFNALDQQVDRMAETFVNGPNGVAASVNKPDTVTARAPFDPVELKNINTVYQAKLTNAIAGAMTSTNALSSAAQAMRQHAKDDGFVTAGAWYMTMAQTSYAMNSMVQNSAPTILSGAVPSDPDSGYSVWIKADEMISYAEKDAAVNKHLPNSATSGPDAAWKLIMNEMDGSLFPLISGQGIVNSIITESSGEPVMIRIKNLADKFVSVSAGVITAVAAVMGYMNDSLIGKIGKLSGIGTGVMAAASVWLDMIKFVAQLAMGFFLMCSIYLPLIPFVVFMGQVLNWLITVVEGVAAAPFLGFAHLDTDGEGLGHKTQYGYTFMLQSFMRPVMLVLGFMFACILLEAIGGYVMQIYPTVIANAQIDSVTGFFSILGYIAIFMIIMVGLVNSCMTVTYLLPDAIFAFIGAHSSATSQVGRDEARNMKDGALSGAGISRTMQPHGLDKQGARDRMKPDASPGSSGVGPSGGASTSKPAGGAGS